MSALALSLAACGGDRLTSLPAVTYVATLKGTNERPRPTPSAATGVLSLRVEGGVATYSVTAFGFQTPLTLGHIHLGSGDVAGPVIVPFTIIAQSGTVAAGSFSLGVPITQGNITISGDSLRSLFDSGQAYVNLYSVAYPDGEVRGQIVRP
ncbi:MAG: CHRD domain-containing protein [bacterium]